MISTQTLDELRYARRFGIGRLLLLARRDFVSRLAARMQHGGESSQSSLPGSNLLPFIDLEGTRSSELARRVGISKQAVAKAIKEMEDAGLVVRVEDEVDGRAFRVSFSEAGLEYLLKIHEAIDAIEQEYEELIGAGEMKRLRRALSAIAYPEE